MPKKIFAFVGYANWGKSQTLYNLFSRLQFQPLHAPISCEHFETRRFTIINASNADRETDQYLERLQNVLNCHTDTDTVFVITISLVFDPYSPNHVRPIFSYLESLADYEVHYLVLQHGWNGKSIKIQDFETMNKLLEHGRVKLFPQFINRSDELFERRLQAIRSYMQQYVESGIPTHSGSA